MKEVMDMLHKMKLNNEPFEMILNGTKTVELRLNDEKRQKVQAGDFIEFSHIEEPECKIQVRVTELYPFPTFAELFQALPKESFGFKHDETVPPDYMDSFYSREAQEKYGALGIGFRRTELQRFIDAQDKGYDFGVPYSEALAEIRAEDKQEHWIWYVFPQIKGLGRSDITGYFSINSIEEASDYYAHPVLRERLMEITSELLKAKTDDPMVIFGTQDAFKLRSCMTLFKYIAPENGIFQQVLDRFCMGMDDDRTNSILSGMEREG